MAINVALGLTAAFLVAAVIAGPGPTSSQASVSTESRRTTASSSIETTAPQTVTSVSRTTRPDLRRPTTDHGIADDGARHHPAHLGPHGPTSNSPASGPDRASHVPVRHQPRDYRRHDYGDYDHTALHRESPPRAAIHGAVADQGPECPRQPGVRGVLHSGVLRGAGHHGHPVRHDPTSAPTLTEKRSAAGFRPEGQRGRADSGPRWDRRRRRRRVAPRLR